MANKRSGITGSVKLTKWDGNVLSASTYTTALATPTAAKEAPETDVATGLLGIDPQGRGRLDLMFGGTGAGGTINYQVVGYRHSQASGANGFVPEIIAAGVATLGTEAFGAGGAYIETAASLWADTITETLASGFALVNSPADNTMARLSIDVSTFIWATVQVERGTATTADVVANLADWIGGLASFDADVTLGNVGLLDSGGVAIDAAAAYAEDTAHTTGDWVTPGGAVRTDTRASLAGTTGDYAPLQLTANGDARVRDDDLLTRMSPPVTSPQAQATEQTDAWNELFTIPANCVFARVVITNSAYIVAGVTSTDPAQNGVHYKPGIVYDIPTGAGNNRLFIKNVTGGGGSDAVVDCTFYCTA